MNSNHCQLFTILIGFRTASPEIKPVRTAVNHRLYEILRCAAIAPMVGCDNCVADVL